jgi:uncharacterized sodium:solute symporter family permease YidK
MIIGALYLMIMSLIKIGGFQPMKSQFSYAVSHTVIFSNSTCGLPSDNFFDIIRDHNSDFPWTGSLAVFFIGIWYWCSDQVIVQRVLAAKNLTHARAGCIMAGYLKILPVKILRFLILKLF